METRIFEEVIEFITQLKNNKAPPIESVVAILLKYRGEYGSTKTKKEGRCVKLSGLCEQKENPEENSKIIRFVNRMTEVLFLKKKIMGTRMNVLTVDQYLFPMQCIKCL